MNHLRLAVHGIILYRLYGSTRREKKKKENRRKMSSNFILFLSFISFNSCCQDVCFDGSTKNRNKTRCQCTSIPILKEVCAAFIIRFRRLNARIYVTCVRCVSKDLLKYKRVSRTIGKTQIFFSG